MLNLQLSKRKLVKLPLIPSQIKNKRLGDAHVVFNLMFIDFSFSRENLFTISAVVNELLMGG